jgi:hypothetical protein
MIDASKGEEHRSTIIIIRSMDLGFPTENSRGSLELHLDDAFKNTQDVADSGQ